jgi:branched-chain amino acid transport system ATP-binding protein
MALTQAASLLSKRALEILSASPSLGQVTNTIAYSAAHRTGIRPSSHNIRRSSKILARRVFNLFPVLRERRKQLAGTLSGGEQQMLAIARDLMSCPKLLMLDEPPLGLAPFLVKRTFETVEEINEEGVTVLLVEQNIHHALSISDRGYVLENGRTIMEGTGEELLSSPHVKKAYLSM